LPLLKKANVFLIQVDSTRKNYHPPRTVQSALQPIFAEDILLHHRLKIVNPNKEEKKVLKKVQENDYIVVFCNQLVPHSPNQIKFIYTVTSIINNQIVLKVYTSLNRGYPLDHLHDLVAEGKLSPEMGKIGEGKKRIWEIAFSDLELLINYDPIVRTYSSTSWKH
jgi:hypothetical protein